MPRQSRKLLRFLSLIIITMILAVLAIIPIRIALTQALVPEPEAIFVLSGNRDRDRAATKLAQKHPELPIWVSVGSERSREIFKEAGIDSNRLHEDNRATDTVTNFTTMVEPFQENHINHVYLITSDYHMRRARAIGTIVFGSRGIILTPVSVSSKREAETITHAARDIGRSVVWLFTGRTGASLDSKLSTIYGYESYFNPK
ncbi:MAG: YdcF family protein [Cyanobacteriota bacterium]